MIIRKLEVAGWRCFANRFVLGEFDEGVNIIHGPNSSGKSSLMSALVRGFFDTHRTASSEIEQLRPWGRSLAPEVAIEYESPDGFYRIVKTWLQNRRAELLRREANSFVRVAEDDQAVEQVRKLFSAAAALRGASAPDHWGTAQVLWSPQRAIALGGASDEVLSQVERALSGQRVSESAHRLTEAMKELHDRYFTSQGRTRSGRGAPPSVSLEEERKELINQREQLRQALDDRQRLAEEIARLEDEHRQREAALGQYERRLNELRPLERKYAEAVARVAQSRTALETVTNQQRQLAERCRKLDEVRSQREKARDDLGRLETDAKEAKAKADEAAAAFQQSELHVRAIEDERPHLRRLETILSAARRWSQMAAEREAIEKTLAEVARLEEQISAAIPGSPGVSRQQIDAMRTAALQRERALHALEAASIRVVVEAEAPLTLESRQAVCVEEESIEQTAAGTTSRCETAAADRMPSANDRAAGTNDLVAPAGASGGPENTISLHPGQRCTIRGDSSVELRLPQVARIRAVGPQMSLDEIRRQLEQAERRWAELVAETGADSLDEAQRRFDEQTRRQTEQAVLRGQREQLLAGRTTAQLQEKADELGSQQEQLLAEYPQWRHAPPDVESLERELGELRGRFDQRMAEAAAVREERRSVWTDAQRHCDRLDHQCRSLREKCGDLDKAERQLASDETDDQRLQRIDELSVSASDARVELRRAEEELAALGGDPSEEVKALEKQCAVLRAEVARLAEALYINRGRMSQLEEQAAYDQWSRANEKLAVVEAQLARERRLMDSIRLLKQTFEKCSGKAAAQWREPVLSRAADLLKRLVGERFSAVNCSDHFRPTEVRPSDHSQAVALDAVAGSEWELVHFAVRLALAEWLGRNCRLPMIFDDALTYTDDERMQRIAALLAESAAQFQILVFTCHPERYRSLSSARWFDLSRLAAEQRQG